MTPTERQMQAAKKKLQDSYHLVCTFVGGPFDGHYFGLGERGTLPPGEPVDVPTEIYVGSPARENHALVYEAVNPPETTEVVDPPRFTFVGWRQRPNVPPAGHLGYPA